MSKIIKRVVMFMIAFMLCFSVPAEVPFSTTITSQAAVKINVKNYELFLKPGEKFQIKVRGVKGKVKYKIEDGKKYISLSKKGLIKAKKAGYSYVWIKTATTEFYIHVHVLCKKHKFKEFVHKEPTSTECGISSYHCTVCGYRTGKKKTRFPELSPYDVQAKIDSLRSKYPEGSKVGICGVFNDKLNKDVFGGYKNYNNNFNTEIHKDLSRLKPGDSIGYDWQLGDYSSSHVVMVYSVEKYKGGYKIVTVDSNHGWDKKAHWDNERLYATDNNTLVHRYCQVISYSIISYYNPSEEYVIKEPEPEPEPEQKQKLEVPEGMTKAQYIKYLRRLRDSEESEDLAE